MFNKTLYEVFVNSKGESKRYYIRSFTSQRFLNLCLGIMRAKNPKRILEVEDTNLKHSKY